MATVTNTYARAFADVVMSMRLDAAVTLAEAQQMAVMARENDNLREVWDAPSISAEKKRAVLDSIVKRAGISRPVRNFVAVLIDHRRTRFLSEIVAQFEQELNQRLGFAEADITTSRELSPAERTSIETDLAQVTSKKIRARYTKDAAILGGAIARVGSTVYDGSVKGQLERIRTALSS
jgi:F-type H+-transporting ATPase subunit delta